MPRPRFHKLPEHKRLRILEAAAQAFATSGYEGTSLNQILDSAAISKGAAYYYFDDKADLFATVVDHYFREHIDADDALFDSMTADSFWSTLDKWYRKFLELYAEQPWAMGLMRAVWRLPLASREVGALQPLFEMGQRFFRGLVRRGRELGAIRTDLPESLLVAWLTGLDLATDRWMAEHLKALDGQTVEGLIHIGMDLLHRLFDPPGGTGSFSPSGGFS